MMMQIKYALSRLDARYAEQPYFVGLKARLLAAFCLLVVIFVPLNVAKLLWVQLPHLPIRLIFNANFALAAIFCLISTFRGRLDVAGSGFVWIVLVPIHGLSLILSDLPQPVGAGIQLFVFDFVILFVALVFASRRTAFFAFLFIVASQVAFHHMHLRGDELPGTLHYAANTLLRDGLIAIGFVFCLGMTVITMITTSHQRSDLAIRETKALNDNLGRLVAERTQELEAATRLAREASRAKGEFLANMSHEIRTPLHGIIASADLLQHRTDLPDSVVEQVRLINDSGDMLMKLLSDILDLSKIESGQFVLECRPFDLSRLVADQIALFSAKAAHSGILLGYSLAPDLPPALEGDGFRIRQVLLNLLSNAVKFTPAGGRVDLKISAESAAGGQLMIHFEISDTGIGIEADALERLFDRFSQADSSTSRRFGGTGLGLAISLHLAKAMGGSLQAESTPGQGSTFRFSVPLRIAEADKVASVEATALPSVLGLNVLIVEDNPINQKLIAFQLERFGCRYRMALDGMEALAALEEGPLPDVVLMDCNLPQMDGWEATRQIRSWANDPKASAARRRAANVPIVALTASSMPEDHERCLSAGMTAFLAKPIRLASLQAVLESLSRG